MSRNSRVRTSARTRVLVLGAITASCWLAGPASAAASASASASAAIAAPIAAPPSPVLTDDAGGQPMFTGPDPLIPGISRSSCITITARGAQAGDQITFAATASGDLLPWLHVRAEAGTGAGHSDCSGFAGQTYYRGRLGDLAHIDGDGADTGWRPVGTSSRSFRITIDVDASTAGMGRTAQASFSWRLVRGKQQTPLPTPAPTRSPAASPPVSPSPSASPASDPVRSGGGPSTATPAPAGSSPTASPSSPEPSSSSRPVATVDVPALGGSPRNPPSGLTATFRNFTEAMQGVIAKPGLTIGPLLIALLFLLTQHLIDMRDPKLAAASRTKQDILLRFPETYGESMHDPQGRS